MIGVIKNYLNNNEQMRSDYINQTDLKYKEYVEGKFIRVFWKGL